MQCPYCQHPDNRVLESRSTEAGQSIRRRRECLSCQRRFTTYERIEFVPITVLKQNGDRESFDRSKLLRGIVRACQKTGLAAVQLEALVDEIESELQQRSAREISSLEIGELVLQHLRLLSEVAYIRFASVYRQFQSIGDFVETLDDLSRRGDTQRSARHSHASLTGVATTGGIGVPFGDGGETPATRSLLKSGDPPTQLAPQVGGPASGCAKQVQAQEQSYEARGDSAAAFEFTHS